MGKDFVAHIGVLTAEFHIPQATSLKEKRSVLRSLRDRVRSEFNVCAAEVGHQDKWQRSQWVFCMVNADRALVDSGMQELIRFLGAGSRAYLCTYELEFF